MNAEELYQELKKLPVKQRKESEIIIMYWMDGPGPDDSGYEAEKDLSSINVYEKRIILR